MEAGGGGAHDSGHVMPALLRAGGGRCFCGRQSLALVGLIGRPRRPSPLAFLFALPPLLCGLSACCQRHMYHNTVQLPVPDRLFAWRHRLCAPHQLVFSPEPLLATASVMVVCTCSRVTLLAHCGLHLCLADSRLAAPMHAVHENAVGKTLGPCMRTRSQRSGSYPWMPPGALATCSQVSSP